MRVDWSDRVDSLVGLEGWYELIAEDEENQVLVVYVTYSNSLRDWLTDFMAWPRRYAGVMCHAGYVPYARWLDKFLLEICIWENITLPKKIVLIGYSMGGGVVQLTGMHSHTNCRIYNIAGPRVCSRIIDGTTYRCRGDIVPAVPFWFRRTKEVIRLGRRIRFFWHAHTNYPLGEIIAEIYGREKIKGEK